MSDAQLDNPYTSSESANPRERQDTSPQWIAFAAIVFGYVVGVVSSYVEPMTRGQVNYEVIVSHLLIIAFLVIAVVICAKIKQPVRWTSSVVVLVWLTYFAGWAMLATRRHYVMAVFCVAGAAVSLVFAMPLLFVLRRLQNPNPADVDFITVPDHS